DLVHAGARGPPWDDPGVDHVAWTPIAERLPLFVGPRARPVDPVALGVVGPKRLARRAAGLVRRGQGAVDVHEVLAANVLLAARVGAVIRGDQHDLRVLRIGRHFEGDGLAGGEIGRASW